MELLVALVIGMVLGAVAMRLLRRGVDSAVGPVQKTLERMDEQVRALEKDRAGAFAAIQLQLESMAETQDELHHETASLVRALRAPAVRGRWGELQLKRVVELAGMLDHCDFFEQSTLSTGDGRLRPDLIVRLAGGRSIVVDSKVPLAAYLEAHEATDDEARRVWLRDHARQLRAHIAQLSARAYWAHLQPAPDFVVCFVPGETLLSAALEHDPGLIELSADQRVILASPLSLIALLRTIAFGWRQDALARNAQEISRLGGELHERVRSMAAHFAAMRRSLEGAVKSYNETVGAMESRVLVSTRKLRELGATATEEIPELEQVERLPRVVSS